MPTTPSTEMTVRARYNLSELGDIARTFAQSGYFKDAQDAAKAFVKVLAGEELGIPPIQAMTGIHIVEGKPTLSATTVGALIKRSGRYDYRVEDLTDELCALSFWQDGEQVGTSIFTIADAKAAGLLRSGSGWAKYPRNMLLARALTNGARWYCPDVFGGAVYTPEELGAAVDEDGEDEGVLTDVIDSGQAATRAAPAPEASEPDPENGAGLTTDASGSEDSPRKRAPEARCTCGHAARSHPEGGACKVKECECAQFVTSAKGSGGGDGDLDSAPLPSTEESSPPEQRSPFQVPDGIVAQGTIEQIADTIARLVGQGALNPEQVRDALMRDYGHADLKQLARNEAEAFLGKLEVYERNLDLAGQMEIDPQPA